MKQRLLFCFKFSSNLANINIITHVINFVHNNKYEQILLNMKYQQI